ncbi:MAG: TonB-dependent receptor, partial [Pseudomonadota bacterium]
MAQPLSPIDTAIGWAVDGTIQPTFGSNAQLLDVERVEVLRGPQNTLFGRGAQGGAVNVVTNLASFDSEFSVNAEGGERGYVKVDGIANGTLAPDLLAGRLALRFAHYGGDIDNVSAGGKDGETYIGAAQGSLLLTPNNRVTAVLRGYYEDDRRDTPPFILRGGPDFPASGVNPENDLDRRLANGSLEVTYDLDSLTLSSTTSFHSNRQEFTSDLTDSLIANSQTGFPPAFFDIENASVRNATLEEQAYQQEFRVSAPENAAVQWLVGTNIYYSDFDLHSDERDITFDFNNSEVETSLNTLSYSAFGETTFPVLKPLSATLGLRVGRDEQDLDSTFVYTGPPNPLIVPRLSEDGRFTDNYIVGSAALSYALSPDDNVYASVRRGHAPGGFATLNRNQFFGEPQIARPASESWTYEIGSKLTFLGGRIRLDAAGFFNDVEDAAFIAFDPALFLSVPVALSYHSYGFELEGQADLGAGFTLYAGVGMTEAEFVDVPSNNPAGAQDG